MRAGPGAGGEDDEEEVNSGWSGTANGAMDGGRGGGGRWEMVARPGWLPGGLGGVVGVAETIRTLRRQQPQPSATPAMP